MVGGGGSRTCRKRGHFYVFVFLEKNLSKTIISRFWPESRQVFWRKKLKSPGFALSEVGRSVSSQNLHGIFNLNRGHFARTEC